MYYLLYGSDSAAVREKSCSLLGSLQKKKPGAAHIRITAENWTPGAIEASLREQGLFERKLLVTFDRLSENVEAWEELMKRREELHDSDNVFLVREGVLTKVLVQKLSAHAGQVRKFEKKNPPRAEEAFQVFSLASALQRKDRKQLWILYQKAKREGVDDAAIQGILFWKVKDMIVRHDTRNYSEEELLILARDLILILFHARRGRFKLEVGLERFTLTLGLPTAAHW